MYQEIDLVNKARDFARIAHMDQKRKSGVEIYEHSKKVAEILGGWGLGYTTQALGYLHNTVRRGAATVDDIKAEFGNEIGELIESITNISNLQLREEKPQQFVDSLIKMLLAMASDLRVVFVRLACRLDSLSTFEYLSKSKQRENALEVLLVYAPLSERLGMGQVKAQLEDLAFPYVYPKEYKRLTTTSFGFYKKAEGDMKKIKRRLLLKLSASGLKVQVNARRKHLYSLWRKLERPEISWDFSKIHDIVALRIIVDTVENCYAALGIVHKNFTPVASIGVSDFIASPKPNGYQSIHTKVFSPTGGIVEVQIRTQVMHEQAEYGLAAHWAYSEAKTKGVAGHKLEQGEIKPDADKLSWVKRLVSWKDEISDSEEFVKAVKFDIFAERIFVFTPKGDIYDLPIGATPVDFAYRIHTRMGNFISGARVNGKMVTLNYKLKRGEVVEIIKSKNEKMPSREWLSFVVTGVAIREIKKRLNKK